MPPQVRAAVVLMIAAFALYSSGVWAVFLTRRLRPWHASLFWLGFLSDTAGTELMRRLAGGFHWTFHTATGGVALLLMLSLIHISEPTRRTPISYAVFCL